MGFYGETDKHIDDKMCHWFRFTNTYS